MSKIKNYSASYLDPEVNHKPQANGHLGLVRNYKRKTGGRHPGSKGMKQLLNYAK